MGKKGKWLSAVKNAFRSPNEEKEFEISDPTDLDLVGEMPPLIMVAYSKLLGFDILFNLNHNIIC